MEPYGMDRFYGIRMAYGPSFSADGKRLAFITNITGVPQLWEVPARGGWPDQLTFAAERVGEARCSPVADELVFVMDAGGNEHHQLFRLARTGGQAQALTRAPEAMHHFGGWSRDGRQVAFSANRRDPRFFDVYVQDVATGREELVWESQAVVWPGAWAPDGQALVVERANTNLDTDLYLVDLQTRAARHLTPHRGEAYFMAPCMSPDGRWVYCISTLDREFAALLRLDLATGRWEAVAEPPWDVEGAALSRDGRYLAYAANAEGRSELHVLDLGAGAEVALPPLPLGVYGQFDWAPDGRRLAFVVDGPRHPMDVWVLDPGAGRVDRVTRSSLAGIPRETFVDPVLVRCPSFDGLAVPAWLYIPPGARPGDRLPTVVHVHGGPESQARPVFNKTIQYLVHRGFAVLAPNVRGSSGYGKAYLHLDDRRRRWDSVADLKACWEWLTREGWADPQRVAVWGGSYGGFMVLAAVTTYPDLWAAGVDIVGIANFETFLQNTHPHRRPLREAEYGFLDQDLDWMRQVSPIYHVDRITAAMMVIHGANDPRVPVDEAEQIVARLRELGRPVEYLRFDDEGHGLVKIPNQIRGYGAAVAFLARHLGVEQA